MYHGTYNCTWRKRGKTTGSQQLNLWLIPSRKGKEQAATGEPLEVSLPQGKPADNDEENRNKGEETDAVKATDSFIDVSRFVRNQLPMKLEFKMPRNTKVFNCAATHKEWFVEVKKKDLSARIITYREAAISEVNKFPKNQAEYNRCIPQRITRQPRQPRVAEVVFEIETAESFQSLKTYNREMMEFLGKKGVFMKMNLASQLKRDSVGFFTHIHAKTTWREDLQDRIVSALRMNMSIQDISTALKSGDRKKKW